MLMDWREELFIKCMRVFDLIHWVSRGRLEHYLFDDDIDMHDASLAACSRLQTRAQSNGSGGNNDFLSFVALLRQPLAVPRPLPLLLLCQRCNLGPSLLWRTWENAHDFAFRHNVEHVSSAHVAQSHQSMHRGALLQHGHPARAHVHGKGEANDSIVRSGEESGLVAVLLRVKLADVVHLLEVAARLLEDVHHRAREELPNIFALRLRHEEPEASFYPTLDAVQATNDDNAVQCWLRLEQDVCARKLVALQAHLRAVCSEYSIELTTEKKEYHFKFPHQRKALKVAKDDICTALAEHAFPLLDNDDEEDPIEGNIGVAAWIARARAVQDADDKDEREKTPQEHDPAAHNKMKRGRSGK